MRPIAVVISRDPEFHRAMQGMLQAMIKGCYVVGAIDDNEAEKTLGRSLSSVDVVVRQQWNNLLNAQAQISCRGVGGGQRQVYAGPCDQGRIYQTAGGELGSIAR